MKNVRKKYNFLKIGLSILVLAVIPVSINLVQKNQENRSQAASNDNGCTSRGGACISVNSKAKNGSYCTNGNVKGEIVYNLCTGNSSRRCCVPFDDHKCANLGGKCGENLKSVKEGDSCNIDGVSGKYIFNKCGGGSDRRCCAPTEVASKITSTPTPTLTPAPTKALVCSILSCSGGGGGSSPSRLSVATFNIGNANKTSKASGKTIGTEIKNDGFDIVGLQESHSALTKSVVSNSGMDDYFFTATSAGNSILSKGNLNNTSYVRLTNCGRDAFRAIQKTIIKINNRDISFYNVHLDPASSCRNTQAKDAIKVIKNDPNPWILVGDFNFGNDCSSALSLLKDYSIVANDEIRSSSKCTDLIIVSRDRGINVVSTKTYKTNGVLSDHNLVSAILEIN